MIGQTFSHYKILAKIGEDATGVLYKAVDQEAGRHVGLKILGPAITADPERRTRLERDAMAASRLEHPNIARIHEFSHSDGVEFVVMEAPEGESAYDFLERERPQRRYLLRFGRQMTSALEAAHAAGILHGPLDPAGIFIDPKRHIKFYDFGFAVLEPPPASEEARRASFGTSAPYVSPEQVVGARPDVRSDIFSFGALLYQMTTSRQAFRAETVSATWKAIVEEEPKPIAQLTSRAPRGMDKLIERCLKKNPERRFQQMADIKPLLEKMVDAYFDNPEHTASFLSKNRGRIAKVAGMALAASAAVGAAVIWWQSRAPQEPLMGKELRQITRSVGFDTEPAISKDGTLLAYASDRYGDGNLDILVQPVDADEPRRLTNDPADDHEPAFSPDGETIAFRSERNGGGVYVAPARGGEALLIAPEGRRPRYSPDGRWIAYWVGPPGFAPRADRAYKMFVVPSGGGEAKQIQPNFASCTYPTWSPDGKSLLFIGRPDATRSDPNAADWWVTSVAGGQLRNTGACRTFRIHSVLPEGQTGIPGDWKGNQVFFSIPSTDGSNIWRADMAPESLAISAKPVRITEGKGIEVQPLASTAGRVVFSRQSYNADIWSVPVAASEGRATGEPKRWTRDPGLDVSPSSSEDGAKLLFQSNRTGHYNVWLLDVKSGKESPVMTSLQEQLWPLVSPDGSKVGFSEMRIGKFEHFYKPIGGGPAEVVCEDCGPAISGWSRDGRIVLIDTFSGTPSRLSVSLINLSSREKTLLLSDPQRDLRQARFSPDGRWIAFSARMDGGVSRLYVTPFRDPGPLPSKEWIALTQGNSWDTAPQFSPDGKLVYFTSTRDGYRCVWAQRLDARGQPAGEAFAVAHFHAARRSPAILPFDNMDLFVAPGQILVSLGEQAGNIWSVKVSD